MYTIIYIHKVWSTSQQIKLSNKDLSKLAYDTIYTAKTMLN